MATCTFCTRGIEKGSGMMVVQKTGRIYWFCSKKCEKNSMKLGRDPRKFKWVKAEKK